MWHNYAVGRIVYLKGLVRKYFANPDLDKSICAYIINIILEKLERILESKCHKIACLV